MGTLIKNLYADGAHGWDLVALLLFLSATCAYFVHFMHMHRINSPLLIQCRMNRFRDLWADALLPEDKVLVVQTARNMLMSSSFLASTAILLLLGVLSALRVDPGLSLIVNRMGEADLSVAHWSRIKLVLLALTYSYAFFNFMHCIRDANYLSYLGPLSLTQQDVTDARRIRAHLLYLLHHQALCQTQGTKAFFFSVPLLLWLVHPLLTIAALAAVLYLMVRRDHFHVTLTGDGKAQQ